MYIKDSASDEVRFIDPAENIQSFIDENGRQVTETVAVKVKGWEKATKRQFEAYERKTAKAAEAQDAKIARVAKGWVDEVKDAKIAAAQGTATEDQARIAFEPVEVFNERLRASK